MTTESVAVSAVPAESKPVRSADKAYVIRLATAYLVVPHDTPDRVEYAPRVVEALEQDPRVTHAMSPELDPSWSPQTTVYPPFDQDGDMSRVLEATRHVHVQQFSDPIAFELRVPAKNQPTIFKRDEIPSEHYFALWDGEALLIGWRQRADAEVGSSGGHVVEEVLQQAAARAGADLMVQACNPRCTYVFLHTAIRATVDKNSPTDWSIAPREGDALLMEVVMSDGDSLFDVSLNVWARARRSLRSFAAMKNRGRQILELERVVRDDLDELNQLHHKRARAGQRSLLSRIQALWTFRSWRRTSRYYLSRLWLGVGSLERLRRAWSDDALNFRRVSDEDNLRGLFTVDTYDEVALVEQLDLRLVESALEHAEDRLSASVLALATFGGAVAGALVAAFFTIA
jgi:hypothetical protein